MVEGPGDAGEQLAEPGRPHSTCEHHEDLGTARRWHLDSTTGVVAENGC